jgi:hypothetical protein
METGRNVRIADNTSARRQGAPSRTSAYSELNESILDFTSKLVTRWRHRSYALALNVVGYCGSAGVLVLV